MSRIFITGDTHRSFQRLFNFQDFEQNDLTRDDYLIICGDFGGIWDGKDGDKGVKCCQKFYGHIHHAILRQDTYTKHQS